MDSKVMEALARDDTCEIWSWLYLRMRCRQGLDGHGKAPWVFQRKQLYRKVLTAGRNGTALVKSPFVTEQSTLVKEASRIAS